MKVTEFKDKIQLTNDGGLQFFFLGTGSAFSKKYFQNNLLVIKGNDHLLIDCGNICPYAFSTYNTPLSEIKNVFVSHSHADHIGGLEELALAGRYVTGSKPKIIITDEYKRLLWDFSLKGGCSYGETSVKGEFMTFADYFDQITPEEIKDAPRPMYHTKIGEIDIKIFRTNHVVSFQNKNNWNMSFYSTGVLIDDRILFPCDTRLDMDLINYMTSKYNIEYIFHDCQFYEGGVHAYIGELEKLPEDLKSKMYLCHYGDNRHDFEDRAKNGGFAGFAERGVYYNFDK